MSDANGASEESEASGPGEASEAAQGEQEGQEGGAKGPGKVELAKLERLDAAIEAIERLLFRLGQQGLQRMSRSSLDELGALEQTAHQGGLTKIERLLGELSTHVERYLERDPLFTMATYVDTVNRVWLLCRATARRRAAGQGLDELIDVMGEARRKFEDVPEPLVLQPIGAAGWVSDTDFVGVTVYFHVAGREGEILQASNCKPCAYFGRSPTKLLTSTISEHVSHTIFEVAHGAFEFRRAKLSKDGRLSLHKELDVTKAPYVGARAYAALSARSWVELVDKLREGELQPVDRGERPLVYVEPRGYGAVVIDQKNARATCELTDGSGAQMLLEVPLREENNLLVDNLERLFGKGAGGKGAGGKAGRLVPSGLFGRAWVEGGRLKFAPMTALYDTAIVYGRRRSAPRRVNEIHLSVESTEDFSPGEE